VSSVLKHTQIHTCTYQNQKSQCIIIRESTKYYHLSNVNVRLQRFCSCYLKGFQIAIAADVLVTSKQDLCMIKKETTICELLIHVHTIRRCQKQNHISNSYSVVKFTNPPPKKDKCVFFIFNFSIHIYWSELRLH
jgi:hypothetical protein